MKKREEITENIERTIRKRRRQTSLSLKLPQRFLRRRRQSRSGRQTSSSSSSSSSFPLQLSPEILSKLPAKSILRFCCVSKQWSSTIKEPYFTKSFETQSTRRPSLLLFYKKDDKFFVFSIPQHNQNRNESLSNSTSQPIDRYSIPYPNRCSFTIKSESVHGLICLQESTNPIIWNPTMRKFSILPKPDTRWKKGITVFLGYDPIERKHKVLAFPYRGSINETYNEFRVLALGSDKEESWRTIKTDHNHQTITGDRQNCIYARCINGVLYYQAYTQHHVRVIMSFYVKSEKLDMIKLPSWVHKIGGMKMISYEGKLAFVESNGNSAKIWVLEDAEKGEWSDHLFSPLTQYEWHLAETFKLLGCTDDGELIYVPRTFLNSFEIIYINPKRETYRRVAYTGIVDVDFRQRNGIGDKRLNLLQFFPNHIESLLALPC